MGIDIKIITHEKCLTIVSDTLIIVGVIVWFAAATFYDLVCSDEKQQSSEAEKVWGINCDKLSQLSP